MIIAQHLNKSFHGRRAVHDVSFELAEGKNLVLLGTSGSGKTTTLRMLNRLVEPDSGEIFINGRNIFEQPAEQLRRGIGYVLQQYGLFPHYTVSENISIVPKLLGWSKQRIEERCLALLKKFQLPPEQFLSAWPNQLSGGQQQRIGLARALAADPPILLMDEPFGALDPITRSSIRADLLHVDELKSKTIVLVTHDVQEAFELGDQICLLHEGKVMQQGTAADLLLRPANDFVKEFLQGPKLQLELKALKILDLWQFLHNGNTVPQNLETFPAEHSVWNLLEHLSEIGFDKNVLVIHSGKKEKIAVGISDLFAALNQMRIEFLR